MVRIGIIDSGCSAAELGNAVAFDEEGKIVEAVADQVGHGTVVAEIIRRSCPNAELIYAQVMFDKPVTSALRIAAALDWFANPEATPKADILCMSFGVAADRDVLRHAVFRAAGAGIVQIASVPASRLSDSKCYPGDYQMVIAATGDARCAWDEVSELNQSVFGVWSNSPERGGCGAAGASIAAARLTGLVAAQFYECGRLLPHQKIIYRLLSMASYRGAERRTRRRAL
ncbi:S8 family serine peptidase [Pseudomonas sp. zbq_4]|uniref:subtilisin-like serine protease QhpE n=1 Tax=Pseudomonas TaxID=286 RepID=UPI00370A7DDB